MLLPELGPLVAQYLPLHTARLINKECLLSNKQKFDIQCRLKIYNFVISNVDETNYNKLSTFNYLKYYQNYDDFKLHQKQRIMAIPYDMINILNVHMNKNCDNIFILTNNFIVLYTNSFNSSKVMELEYLCEANMWI